MKRWWPGVVILLILWTTRLISLDTLPLHNDEGLHLTRAVEVWNGHPFWVISDGKIINHWLIAAFYPQNAPVFAGRIATLFVSLLGLAAAYALAHRVSGQIGAVLAGALWLASPYLFFYERLAFSDSEAGALVIVALWSAFNFTRSGRLRWAVATGLAFAAACLFKFTAAPFALSVALVVWLTGGLSPRQRWQGLLIIGGLVAVCFAPPLGYLMLREKDFFSIALGWISGSSGGGQPSFIANLTRLWSEFTGFGTLSWVILMLCGLLSLLIWRKRLTLVLLAAALLPLLIILLLGREVLSRHYVVTLPALLVIGGIGLVAALERIRDSRSRQMTAAFGITALAFGVAPFFLTSYSSPATLPLPEDARYEHMTSHSSGYGLREAVESFPTSIARRDLPIVASMFPDSCRRANFYTPAGFNLICTNAPGKTDIEALLKTNGAVYVLVDSAPSIGIDVNTITAAKMTRIGAYPRPGETLENASVVLWLLEASSEGVSAADCVPGSTTVTAYKPTAGEFVTLNDRQFQVAGTPFTVRGVNYYPSRYPWRRFLTSAELSAIQSEMALLRTTGFNTLRLFIWNDALFACLDQGAVPIQAAFQRLDSIIQAAAQRGFHLIVTLNDLADLTHNVLYSNPDSVQAQTRLIVERYRAEPAILAWDLRNEGDIDYGSNNSAGPKFARETVLSWLEQTSAAVRSLDNNHLITAGWLYDNASTAPYVDFVSLHHWDNANVLQDRLKDLSEVTDKPILLEEFGYSTFRVSPEDQRSLLLANAQAAEENQLLGWMVWTAFDFPLDATCIPPACPSVDNAEHHFGLWYTDYSAKPAIAALATLLKL